MITGATGIDGLRRGLTVACRGFRCLVKLADRNNCRIITARYSKIRNSRPPRNSFPFGGQAEEGKLAVKPRSQT
jgi:hypothetical protein